ncbi:MAG TPA: hypothetical protein VFD27_16370 [Chthoniobacteraceae bacterium]|nr:hypothetical protein [Chthoniobacteraceae bacterium]
MKPRTLLAIGIVVLLATALWWRQSAQEATIAELQRRLANTPAAPANEVLRTAVPDYGRPAAQPVEELSDDSAARIAQLERVADGQADIIEDLLRRSLEAFEEAQRKARASGWSALQATGAPDSMRDGDQQTAWAPAQADGGEEWLELEYANGVPIAQVNVREVCGPGCITKVVALLDGGAEVPIWQGEPPVNASPSNTMFAAPPNIVARRVKVYLDTKRVAGWNEIDAVELVGRDGSRQWAKSASASSSYGASTGLSLGDGAVFFNWGRQQHPTPVEDALTFGGAVSR